MKTTTPDVSTLPKWAQYRISKLEADLNLTQAELKAFQGSEQTAITVDPDNIYLGSGRIPSYLPERTTISYRLKHGDIEIDLRDGVLKVMSTGMGKLIVSPSSSNTLTLEMIEDL